MLMDWITGKKVRLSVSISPESLEALNQIAQKDDLTLSEVVEYLSLHAIARTISPQIANSVTTTPQPLPGVDATADSDLPLPVEPQPEVSSAPPASPPPSPWTPSEVQIPQGLPILAGQENPADQPRGDSPELDSPALIGLQQQVKDLQAQLQDMQMRLSQRRDQQAAQQSKYLALSKKSSQQHQQITQLEAEIVKLRQVAAIGEAQLNRWRSQHFSR